MDCTHVQTLQSRLSRNRGHRHLLSVDGAVSRACLTGTDRSRSQFPGVRLYGCGLRPRHSGGSSLSVAADGGLSCSRPHRVAPTFGLLVGASRCGCRPRRAYGRRFVVGPVTKRSWLNEFVWVVPLLVPLLHLCVERWLSVRASRAANAAALPLGVRTRGGPPND